MNQKQKETKQNKMKISQQQKGNKMKQDENKNNVK